jgi:hypothetical protein
MAQLHLAFASPITAVKSQDERKFADQLGKLDLLVLVIRQFNIGEPLADFQIHGHTSVVE